MQPEKGDPLYAVATIHVGPINAGKVITYIVAWAWSRAHHKSDEPFDVDALAEMWLKSRAQSFRDQALFRAAFPGDSTPDRLLDLDASIVRDLAKTSRMAMAVKGKHFAVRVAAIPWEPVS